MGGQHVARRCAGDPSTIVRVRRNAIFSTKVALFLSKWREKQSGGRVAHSTTACAHPFATASRRARICLLADMCPAKEGRSAAISLTFSPKTHVAEVGNDVTLQI